MTPYYPTINEDLTRAKDILAKGKLDDTAWSPDLPTDVRAALSQRASGAIYGADTYAAYKLLESFVQHIEYLHQQQEAGQNYTDELETFKEHAIALNKKAAETMAKFYGLFSDHDDPCESFEQAEAIWNDMRDRHVKQGARLEQMIADLREQNHRIIKEREELEAQAERLAEVFWKYDVPSPTALDEKLAELERLRTNNLSYRQVVEDIAAAVGPHAGTAGTPENIFETVKRIIKEREAALLEVARVSDLLDTFHTANDAVQDWVNTNASLVPEGLEQLLSELDVVLNGK